jgi:hypothetical protein
MLFRLLLVAGIVAASVPARSQPRRIAATEKARNQLATADRAFRQGDYELALTHVQAAYAIDPRAEYLIVFAQIYRAMGDEQRAVNACEVYLATAPDGPRASEARGLLGVARAELERKRAPAAPPSEPAPSTAPPSASPPPAPTPSAPAAPPPAPPVERAPAPIVAAKPPTPTAPPPRRRRLVIGLSVGAVGVVVAGVALGVGLGLGLPHGPQKIPFDPR